MNNKIFITGGAGFIGSALVTHLQRLQYQVMVNDNLSFGNRDFIKVSENYFIHGDILDYENLLYSMVRFSPHYVIHLAAIHFIPYCNQHPFESANIIIKGTTNVLAACKLLPAIEKIIFASTAAVYPIYDFSINESVSPSPLDIYGLSKFAGEE